MSNQTRRYLKLTIIEVILCVILANVDKVLPDQMGNVLSIIVFIIKTLLMILIFYIYWWILIRPHRTDDGEDSL